jgi:hypothetical protein
MLNFAEIVQTIKTIVESRIALIRSDIEDQLSGVLSRLVLLVLIGSFFLFGGLFFSLSAAFYISQVTQNPSLGFLVVGFVYFVVVVVLYLTKDANGLQQRINVSLKRFIFKSTSEKNPHE